MANPFKDWTEVNADEHNRRVAACKSAPKIEAHPSNHSALARALAGTCEQKKPQKPLLNKTERRFLDMVLKPQHAGLSIGCQNITLRLGHDLRYTPDFWVALNRMTFWEVKGAFIREDGMVKLKAAAAMFPMFTFILAQWKDDQWTIKPIPAQ